MKTSSMGEAALLFAARTALPGGGDSRGLLRTHISAEKIRSPTATFVSRVLLAVKQTEVATPHPRPRAHFVGNWELLMWLSKLVEARHS